jgi:tricorn protease
VVSVKGSGREFGAAGLPGPNASSRIRKRTAGAGIWLSSANLLVDNGIMRAAEFATYGAEGTWLIEGVGVAPDIEVDSPPRATAAGGDAQLDAALAHLRSRIAAEPRARPPPPAYVPLRRP